MDEAVLRDLQTGLAAATQATVVILNEYGHPALVPSTAGPFGAILGSTEAGAAACVARLTAVAAAAENQLLWVEDPERGLFHLAVPMVSAGERLGVVVVGDRPSESWQGQHADRLAADAQVEATAIEAAARHAGPWTAEARKTAAELTAAVASMLSRLCRQDEQLRSRIDELAAVYNVANLLVGTRDLQEILNQAARTVCEVMQTKACSIRLLDEHTGELVIKAVYNLSERYLQKGPVHVAQNPIDAEAFKGNIVYIEDAPNDSRVRYPDEARREGIVSGLVCGMVYQGKPLGVIRIYTGEKHRFSAFEWGLLRAVAAQAAAAIVNARLYQAALEAERYERQLKYAGEVQRRMIPAAAPDSVGATFGRLYKPSREVGGDFYDFIELPGGNLGVAIADVVGKGVPAALMMASLRSALRVYTYHIYDVERIMARVNEHLCRETRSNEFATVFYGVLTPDARRLTYCNAGHEPPLLLRNGRITPLETGGIVIGAAEGQAFDKGILELRRDDVLLLYTDGMVESMNFADEEFGRGRLRESLLKYGRLDADSIVKNILWDVRRFIGLSDPGDDMTMVAIRVR